MPLGRLNPVRAHADFDDLVKKKAETDACFTNCEIFASKLPRSGGGYLAPKKAVTNLI